MMKLISACLVCLLLLVAARPQTPRAFDLQGHRGCRGLMPENTLPAFLRALELGVDTLEMDVTVSRDRQLVVSHDAWFSADISSDRDGKPIDAAREKQLILFTMDYAEIKQYDVGLRGNPRFPTQQKLKAYKPTLPEVFRETQAYARRHKLDKPMRYNIETKSTPAGDNLYHPPPAIFARLLYDAILAAKLQDSVSIQSFDVRTLQEFKKFPVQMPLVLLVENRDGIEKNIAQLGFQPDIYSPQFRLLDNATIAYCRARGIKIIPWTVNEIADMERLKVWQLDGIITDYPDRARSVFRR